MVSSIAAPLNDDYASRTIVRTGVSITGTNVGASWEAGERDARNRGMGTYGSSVWFEWRAAGDGVYTMSTAGSSFQTIVAVYRVGTTVSDATLVCVGAG